MTITMDPIGEVVSVNEAKQESDRFMDRIETIRIREQFVEGLTGLEPGQKLQILFYFHKSEGFKNIAYSHHLKINTGVFHTRCPHRPNGIGVTVVTLISINNGTLVIDGGDMIEGTPILDIKPWNA